MIEHHTDPEKTDNDDDSLEQRAFDDLDIIAELSKYALTKFESGDFDQAEWALRAINTRATQWEDPYQ